MASQMAAMQRSATEKTKRKGTKATLSLVNVVVSARWVFYKLLRTSQPSTGLKNKEII